MFNLNPYFGEFTVWEYKGLSAHNLHKAELNEWTKYFQEQLNLFIKQLMNDNCGQLHNFRLMNPHAEKVWQIYFNWILGMHLWSWFTTRHKTKEEEELNSELVK